MTNRTKPRATLDLCKLVVDKQMMEMGEVVATAQTALEGDPPEGSYAARVTDFARALPTSSAREAALRVVLNLTTAATKMLWNVRDHAVAFQAAINDSRRPTTSLMTLARAMLEGTLLLAHVLEPVGPQLTLARGMAHWIDTMEGTLRTLRRAPEGMGPDLREIEDIVSSAYEYFGDRGFTILRTPKKAFTSTRVQFEEAEAIVDLKATSLAEHFLSQQPELYAVLSGTVHSESWLLGAAFRIGDEPGDFATYEQSWGAAVTAALDVSNLLVMTLQSALDLDVSAVVRRTRLRRRALVASVQQGPAGPMIRGHFRTASSSRPLDNGQSFGLGRNGKRS